MSYSSLAVTSAHVARIARALADPTRLDIFRTIAARGECCCGDISRCLEVTPATVTHHLRILTEAGLVASRREGQFIRLQPDAAVVDTFCRSLASLTTPANSEEASAQPRARAASTTRRGAASRSSAAADASRRS